MTTDRQRAGLKERNKREVDRKLDVLEKRIGETHALYEQYFIDIIPHPPEEKDRQIKLMIKALLKEPFKQQAVKFRLRTLITRYQTYNTYWTRVMKQREEGTYSKDLFKADAREKAIAEAQLSLTDTGKAEKGFQQLFKTYEGALQKAGANTKSLNYNDFRKSLLSQAKRLKQAHGVTNLNYKISVKNGKVAIRAQAAKKKSKG